MEDDEHRSRGGVARELRRRNRSPVDRPPASNELSPSGEPPVVARLMVEIRSDGRTTIARGAVEDIPTDSRVAVEARGTTPLSLALSLARAMVAAPSLARGLARAFIPRGHRRRRRDR